MQDTLTAAVFLLGFMGASIQFVDWRIQMIEEAEAEGWAAPIPGAGFEAVRFYLRLYNPKFIYRDLPDKSVERYVRQLAGWWYIMTALLLGLAQLGIERIMSYPWSG